MLYRRTDTFFRDFEKLNKEDKLLVKNSFPDVVKALEGNPDLYRKFKIKKMKKDDRIWEGHLKINLVFTMMFEIDENNNVCFFRRIGTHDIYNRP